MLSSEISSHLSFPLFIQGIVHVLHLSENYISTLLMCESGKIAAELPFLTLALCM